MFRRWINWCPALQYSALCYVLVPRTSTLNALMLKRKHCCNFWPWFLPQVMSPTYSLSNDWLKEIFYLMFKSICPFFIHTHDWFRNMPSKNTILNNKLAAILEVALKITRVRLFMCHFNIFYSDDVMTLQSGLKGLH